MDQEFRDQKLAAIWTLLAGVVILLIKFWAYNLTGSQAVLSDALESIINVVTAITLLIVIFVASKPADREHPYGHGKIEYFSAAFEGGLIAFASLLIFYGAIQSFLRGPELRQLDHGALILAGAGVLNLLLGLYLKAVGKKRNSLALLASGTHVLTDFWTSVGVIIAVGLVHLSGWLWLDPLMALFIALHLTASGMKLVLTAARGLMDAEDPQILRTILDLFQKHQEPGMIRIHHTRVIRAGQYHHIDAHIVVPEFWPVDVAHRETERFENKVIKDYPTNGEIHFHVDPCRRSYCRVCEVENCPVRTEPFRSRVPLTMEEMQSPVEAEEFLKRRPV